MKTVLPEYMDHLPVRSRVALALASSERVIDTLHAYPKVLASVRNALEAAWRWEAGSKVNLRDLYSHIQPLLESELEFPEKSRAWNALSAAISAIYYTVWQASRMQDKSPIEPIVLPNDVAEISDAELLRCLQYAANACEEPTHEEEWQKRAAGSVSRDFPQGDSDTLGKSVTREYFR